MSLHTKKLCVADTELGRAFHESMKRRAAVLSPSFRAPGRPDPRMDMTIKDSRYGRPASEIEGGE